MNNFPNVFNDVQPDNHTGTNDRKEETQIADMYYDDDGNLQKVENNVVENNVVQNEHNNNNENGAQNEDNNNENGAQNEDNNNGVRDGDGDESDNQIINNLDDRLLVPEEQPRSRGIWYTVKVVGGVVGLGALCGAAGYVLYEIFRDKSTPLTPIGPPDSIPWTNITESEQNIIFKSRCNEEPVCIDNWGWFVNYFFPEDSNKVEEFNKNMRDCWIDSGIIYNANVCHFSRTRCLAGNVECNAKLVDKIIKGNKTITDICWSNQMKIVKDNKNWNITITSVNPPNIYPNSLCNSIENWGMDGKEDFGEVNAKRLDVPTEANSANNENVVRNGDNNNNENVERNLSTLDMEKVISNEYTSNINTTKFMEQKREVEIKSIEKTSRKKTFKDTAEQSACTIF